MSIEMAAAEDRARNARALVWWGAMLPYQKKPPGFDEFVGGARNRAEDVARCVAAWDRVDRALARNTRKGST